MTANPDSGPWVVCDPWTIRHPNRAVVDDVTEVIVDEAALKVTLLRAPLQFGDRLAQLHALMSLSAQIRALLPDVVAGARDQGHTWADIADQLGVTRDAARRRYRSPIRTDKTTR